MKAKWMLLPLAALTVAAAVYGGYIRTTLTDYTSGENWRDNFHVALMVEGVGLNIVEVMREELPSAPYILRVEILGDLELASGIGQQKVKVAQVYVGEGIEVGQEFYLYHDSWRVSYVNGNSLGRGYINVLDVGREYLVFLKEEIDTLDDRVPVYSGMEGGMLSDGSWMDFMAPIFCYDHIDNVTAPITGEWGMGVAYTEVRDNEFFGATEKLIESWEQMKEEFLQMYPR